jgi:hypothetical protein
MPRYISPQEQYFDTLGVPLNGGKLFFYQPSTLVLKNTYSNTALTIPNTNPIILATNGSPVVDIWLDGVYRVILKDSNDNVVWDKDPVGGDSGSLIAYSNWANGLDYPIGEIVTGSNGRYYVSITSPNIGQNPISSPVYWTETRLLRVYNANETYQIGTIVQDSSGQLWRAKALTAGSAPALGSAFWEPAVDGIDELNLLSAPSNLAGPANLAKSRFYRLTSTAMYTLPAVATVAVNEPIYLTKDVALTPTVQAQSGEKIRIGASPSSTQLYDNFLYTVNSTLTLVSDGAEWELS